MSKTNKGANVHKAPVAKKTSKKVRDERVEKQERSHITPEFVEVDADEPMAVSTKSSVYDSMVDKCLAMDAGERFGVRIPEDKDAANIQLRVMGVIRRRVKGHPDAEGYKFTTRFNRARDMVIVTCVELEK